MPSADLSQDFAAFVAGCKFSDLPASAIDGARKSILDTIGVILAASGTEPQLKGMLEVVLEAGGAPEASIWGFGGRAPALMAGFANGAMAHCLDFDDHAPEGHHPSSSIVPVAFALAERAGGISGRDLVTAVAAGQDLFLRLRRNVESRQDWHLSTVLGVFSATATAAHLLRLTADQTINAFGIAGVQCSGTMELAYGVGSALRGMYAGFTTKSAILAALMASKGVTGTRSMFEGKAGLFPVYFGGKYHREKMLENLGTVFSGGDILYKPWPSCGASHGPIHATLELMKEHGLTVDGIQEIRVIGGDFQYQLCQPLEARRKPATSPDAKFSIPFSVAVAATYGEVKVPRFFGEGLHDPKVLAAAQKVVPELDASYNWAGMLPKGRVIITTTDGRRFERLGENVPGDIECPMDWAYLADKFRDAAGMAARRPADAAIEQAIALARRLEELDDATELVRVLA